LAKDLKYRFDDDSQLQSFTPNLFSTFEKICKCRPDSSSVSIEDIQAFGKEQSASKAKVASNVFAKQSWEE